jgi:hypothetical protein
MRVSGIYRLAAVVAITMVATGAAMVSAGTAWGVSGHYPYPVLRANDATQNFELTIPRHCPEANPDCVWMLFVDEPKVPGHPIVAMVKGTSGTLAVPYPAFCGVLQADALIGPAPWQQTIGIRKTLDDCTPPVSTTTTTVPSTTTTTTTTVPSTTTTSTTVASTTTTVKSTATTSTTVPPNVASAASSSTTGTSALPFTAAQSGNGSTATTHGSGTAQLPYTGTSLKPLVILGVTLILLGGMLLSTVESRRRMLRRASAIRLEQVKEGTRRTSSWFLGL